MIAKKDEGIGTQIRLWNEKYMKHMCSFRMIVNCYCTNGLPVLRCVIFLRSVDVQLRS